MRDSCVGDGVNSMTSKPLLRFCQNFLTTVAILLEAGSHVNAQTLGGETGLMKVRTQNRITSKKTKHVERSKKKVPYKCITLYIITKTL